jgi:hypothetical protein
VKREEDADDPTYRRTVVAEHDALVVLLAQAYDAMQKEYDLWSMQRMDDDSKRKEKLSKKKERHERNLNDRREKDRERTQISKGGNKQIAK